MASQSEGIRRADLLDLPDELILHIFDHATVTNETLYTLSQVCKRLHELCLGICYGRFNLKNPQKHAKVAISANPDRVDALSILDISLKVVTLERLVCKFPTCEDDLPSLIRCVHRAANFVARLQSIGKVILVFSNESCCCCGKNNSKPKLEDGILHDWSAAMGRLMNTILERSCHALVVKGGRYLGHLFAFRRTRPSQTKFLNPIEAVKTFFTNSKSGEVIEDVKRAPRVTRGDNWEFKQAAQHRVSLVLTDVSPLARDGSKLRSLTIQSMMFLMPPLLQWTISAMQYSKLENLTLGSLSINYKCWPAIFALLERAAPDLLELSLTKLRQIDPGDLLKFLGRFPKLTSLTIHHEVESVDSYNLGPFPDFPKLISLHAPASWVFKLLSAHQRGLECLEYLCITYRLRNDGLSHWLRQCPNPSIPSLLGDQLRPLTLCLEVRLGDSPAWKMFQDIDAEPSQSQKSCLELVSSISLLVEEEFAKSDMPLLTVLPKWLSMFPAVRFLTISGHNSAIDGMDLFESLIAIVKAKKLHLQSLDVNGKEAEFVRSSSKSSS